MNESNGMTRRGLLGRAPGAAALTAALDSEEYLNAQTATPRVRELFDYGWRFFKGDAAGAQQPAFADSGRRSLDLPHDRSVEGPFTVPMGIGWYRKRFHVPASFENRVVSIDFDRVYRNSEVWIQGQYFGLRPSGDISFACDLTATTPGLKAAIVTVSRRVS